MIGKENLFAQKAPRALIVQGIKTHKTVNAQKLADLLGLPYSDVAITLSEIPDVKNLIEICPNCHRPKEGEHKTFTYGEKSTYGRPIRVCISREQGTKIVYERELDDQPREFVD